MRLVSARMDSISARPVRARATIRMASSRSDPGFAPGVDLIRLASGFGESPRNQVPL